MTMFQATERTFCATLLSVGLAGMAVVTCSCSDARADDPEPVESTVSELVGPTFDWNGELIRPSDVRQWVNLTASLNLSYDSEVDPNAPPPDPNAPPPPSVFQNVFASPAAYQTFLRRGTWPNGTMLIIEIRQALTNPTVRAGALVQGAVMGYVADVKDQLRFGGNGWRFFSFADKQGNIVDAAAPLDQTAPCYSCHSEHGAVDNTMVQFYPSLFDVAKQKGTVRSDWDPNAKL